MIKEQAATIRNFFIYTRQWQGTNSFKKILNKLSARLKVFHAFRHLDLSQLSSSVQHLCCLTSWSKPGQAAMEHA